VNDESILADARAADLAKVRRARAMTGEARVLAGPRLFSGVCRRMREGLADENPGATATELHELLLRRLEKLARLR
jgi:hypothetical protein